MLAYIRAMARRAKTTTKSKTGKGGRSNARSAKSKAEPRIRPFRWLRRTILRLAALAVVLAVCAVAVYGWLNPRTGIYMKREELRLGQLDHQWVPIEEVAPVMARSVVAAEDANFCSHWGFDIAAIRTAIEAGGNRGASTLTQQVVKNVYLWHGRSWLRKALEASLTPMVELIWSKRRIVEVYLNMAEFDEGVFGIDAAAHHYFGIGPDALSDLQAARLAAILPSPKSRSPVNPDTVTRRRTAAIMDGAATIRNDGRSACFEE